MDRAGIQSTGVKAENECDVRFHGGRRVPAYSKKNSELMAAGKVICTEIDEGSIV